MNLHRDGLISLRHKAEAHDWSQFTLREMNAGTLKGPRAARQMEKSTQHPSTINVVSLSPLLKNRIFLHPHTIETVRSEVLSGFGTCGARSVVLCDITSAGPKGTKWTVFIVGGAKM